MRFPLLAPLLLVVACSYSKNVGVSANGSENQLYFSQVYSADLGVVPVGVSRTVTVSRSSGGSVECHGLGTGSTQGDLSSQTVRPSGGSINLPADTCGSIAPEHITLESATCDDDACTVTSEDNGTSVTLHVASKSKDARATRLHVALKSTKDATAWHDSIAVSFAPAARIELTGSFRDLAALRLPILPGVVFGAPPARVVDANGQPMSIDDDTLKATSVTNGVFDEAEDTSIFGSFIAKKPGKGALKWELAGAIAREVEIEVVDRAEARMIALFPPFVAKDATRELSLDLDDLTAETLSPKDALETVAFTTSAGASSTFSTRVRLADGRAALAPIDSVTVEPATLLRPALASDDDWSLTLSDATSSGTSSGAGTLTLEAAGLTKAWPITVTASKAELLKPR
jgi:hypothetical protein